MAYSLAELNERGHDSFFEARHSGGYFRKVIGLHPLADRVKSLTASAERHRFSEHQDVIEAKSARLGLPKLLAPLDILMTQRRLLADITRLVHNENVSVIAATDPLYSGLFGLLLKRRTGLPLVLHVIANYDLNYALTGSVAMPRLIPSRWVEKRIIRHVLSNADLVAAGSETIRNYAIAQGAKAERTELFRVAKNMVPEHRVPIAQRQPLTSDERARLGIVGAKKLLLTVARLEPVKMVDHSIRALSIIVENHPDALLLLAGEGSDRQRLSDLANELGVAQNVRFLGLIDQQLLARLAPGCIALSPLTGMALFETSMGGCPALAYDCDTAIADLVETNVTGELLKPRDWKSMGRAASEILADQALYSRLSQAIRTRAETITDEQALFAHEHAAFDRMFSRISCRMPAASNPPT